MILEARAVLVYFNHHFNTIICALYSCSNVYNDIGFIIVHASHRQIVATIENSHYMLLSTAKSKKIIAAGAAALCPQVVPLSRAINRVLKAGGTVLREKHCNEFLCGRFSIITCIVLDIPWEFRSFREKRSF